MSRVGENIKSARLESGLTQKQLGKKLGVAEGYINEIELGRKVANEAFISKISKALNKDLNDLTLYSDVVEEESAPSKSLSNYENKKTKVQQGEIKDIWSNALSGVLKNVPIYDYSLAKVKGIKALPLASNKVEGYAQDKVLYLEIQDEDMLGFRLNVGDLAFGYLTSEIENNSICLIEYNGIRAIRQIKRLDNTKLLLVSNRGTVKTETSDAKSTKIIARLIRAEIKL